MALATLVVLGAHWVSLGSSSMPALRRRIRGACGLVMMGTVPVLAYALGIASPEQPRAFAFSWLLVTALLVLVLVLAMADMACVWREALAARRELLLHAIATREAVLAQAREQIASRTRSAAPSPAPAGDAANDQPIDGGSHPHA